MILNMTGGEAGDLARSMEREASDGRLDDARELRGRIGEALARLDAELEPLRRRRVIVPTGAEGAGRDRRLTPGR